MTLCWNTYGCRRPAISWPSGLTSSLSVSQQHEPHLVLRVSPFIVLISISHMGNCALFKIWPTRKYFKTTNTIVTVAVWRITNDCSRPTTSWPTRLTSCQSVSRVNHTRSYITKHMRRPSSLTPFPWRPEGRGRRALFKEPTKLTNGGTNFGPMNKENERKKVGGGRGSLSERVWLWWLLRPQSFFGKVSRVPSPSCARVISKTFSHYA